MNVAIDPIVGAWREGGVLLVLLLFFWFRGPMFTKEIFNVYAMRIQNQHALAMSDQTIASRLLDQFEKTQSLQNTLDRMSLQLDTLQRNMNMVIDHLFKGDMK